MDKKTGRESGAERPDIRRYRTAIKETIEKIEDEKRLKRIYDLAIYLYVGGD